MNAERAAAAVINFILPAFNVHPTAPRLRGYGARRGDGGRGRDRVVFDCRSAVHPLDPLIKDVLALLGHPRSGPVVLQSRLRLHWLGQAGPTKE